jgi:hypothetical protein
MENFLYYEGNTMIFPKVETEFWYRTRKSINLKYYVELSGIFSFKLVSQLVERYHSVVSRKLKVEDLISKRIL